MLSDKKLAAIDMIAGGRKLVDIETTFAVRCEPTDLLVGAVGRGQYEASVRELIERTDIVFSTMIETRRFKARPSGLSLPSAFLFRAIGYCSP